MYMSKPIFQKILDELKDVHYGMYNTKLKQVLYAETIKGEVNLFDYLKKHGDGDFKILTPKEVLKYKAGTCWDTSLYIYSRLKEEGFKPQIVFFVIGKDDGPVTHTTVVVQYRDQLYNIEYSDNNKRGVHKIDKVEDVLIGWDPKRREYFNPSIDVEKILSIKNITPQEFIKITKWNELLKEGGAHMKSKEWYGVDFDGTLAKYDKWRGIEHTGEPIKPMVDRVKRWLNSGRNVKIFTARVAGKDGTKARPYIEAWCKEHLGQKLEVTNIKDHHMIELWDDRAVQVKMNTGKPITEYAEIPREIAEEITEKVKLRLQLKINNSRASMCRKKWKDPGAKMFNKLMDAFWMPSNTKDNFDYLNKVNSGEAKGYQAYLKEAYLLAPVNDIKNSPHGRTTYASSGCKYLHHTIVGDKLVVSREGLRKAYISAWLSGDIKKREVIAHFNRHLKEARLRLEHHHGEIYLTEEYQDKINQNFDDIHKFLESYIGINSSVGLIQESVEALDIEDLKNRAHFLIESMNYKLMNEKSEYPGWYELTQLPETFQKLVKETNDKIVKCLQKKIKEDKRFERLNNQKTIDELVHTISGQGKHKWVGKTRIKNLKKGITMSGSQGFIFITDAKQHWDFFDTHRDQSDPTATYEPIYKDYYALMQAIEKELKDEINKVSKTWGLSFMLRGDPIDQIHQFEFDMTKGVADFLWKHIHGEDFLEKSHSLLKSSFRIGVNPVNGHIIKIVFDLRPESILQMGDHANRQDRDYDKDNKSMKNIQKTGHTDFSSKGKVKAIVDMDTKESLKAIQVIGVVGSSPGRARMSVPAEFQNKKLGEDSDTFTAYPRETREKIAQQLNIPATKGDKFVVGEVEEIPSYKSTKSVFSTVTLFNNQWKPGRGIDTTGMHIKKAILKLSKEFELQIKNLKTQDKDGKLTDEIDNIVNRFNRIYGRISDNIKDREGENFGQVTDAPAYRRSYDNLKGLLEELQDIRSELKTEAGIDMMDQQDWDFLERALMEEAEKDVERSITDNDVRKTPPSHAQKIYTTESDRNGKRRKALYIEFIKWAKDYNPKNTFSSNFDKDVFNVTYPFIPEEMRFFYRIANPTLVVLSGNLTFFQISELRQLNQSNPQKEKLLIFAATDTDLRVFNKDDKKVYRAEQGKNRGPGSYEPLVLGEVLSAGFDTYIQKMVGKGDILGGPIPGEDDVQTETVAVIHEKKKDEKSHKSLTPAERVIAKQRFGDVGCSFGRDDDGVFAYTHRARSKSYPDLYKLPKDKVAFISSTS